MSSKGKEEKQNKDARFLELERLSDLFDRLEPQSHSMLKFNIIIPYSDGPDIKPVLWNN